MGRPDYLDSGEIARLVPVAAQTELKNTSVTCAILMAVDEFSDVLLSPFGAPIGKRSAVKVWLEPVFKMKEPSTDRPDALIVVTNGKREWRALVEAKAKNADLVAEQVDRYLDLAKQQGIDAVITISNQFVATPVLSPCDVSKQKLKKVALFHWSWSYLETEAKIQLSKSAVSDPDQAYFLSEYVRYLEHDSAGVSEFQQMGLEWVDACKLIYSKSTIDKKSPIPDAVIRDWDELMRCTALRLSRTIETNVSLHTTPKERKDPSSRLVGLRTQFLDRGTIGASLNVPDAASPIAVEVDLSSRSVSVAMWVNAPTDRKRATASINWLVRQLAKSQNSKVAVVAKWPGRSIDTYCELEKLREDPELLAVDRKGMVPRAFVLKIVSDLGGRFTQRRNFVPEFVSCVTDFYESVGQYVVQWQAPPPKPKKTESNEDGELD